jgi:hypothetical protein
MSMQIGAKASPGELENLTGERQYRTGGHHVVNKYAKWRWAGLEVPANVPNRSVNRPFDGWSRTCQGREDGDILQKTRAQKDKPFARANCTAFCNIIIT